MKNRTVAQQEATKKMRSALNQKRAKSYGWQSAEVTNNPCHLVKGAVSTRVNVHINGIVMEILIHDLDASREDRWTSIIFNRQTGETHIGRSHDSKEAWKIAHAEQVS